MGIVLGPTIGGFLLQYLSWHWIFYVNVPVGALSLLLSLLYLPPMHASGPRERFDFFGAIVLAAGLLCFTLAMTVGQQVGFLAPPTLALLAAGVLALPLFIWRERRAPYAMVDLNLFRIPQFSLNLFTATLTFVAISGVVLLLPFYLELVMQLNLRDVGLMMAIVPLVMVALQPLSGTLSDRLGTRPVSMVGLAFIFFGYLAMATLPVNGTPLGFSLRMLPVSIGMATFNSPNNSAIMGAVPRQRLGVASGLLGMMRTLGQVTGIAVLGAFFTSRVAAYAGVNESLRQVPPSAIVAALHDQFLLVAGLILVGIVVAGFTWRWEIKTRREAQRVQMQVPVVE
jgi:MFS family permease